MERFGKKLVFQFYDKFDAQESKVHNKCGMVCTGLLPYMSLTKMYTFSLRVLRLRVFVYTRETNPMIRDGGTQLKL